MKKQVLTHYPGARSAKEITGDYLSQLEEVHGFDLENTLLATSICVDDINVSTEFRQIQDRPFIMGGLGGVPFVGRTGMAAYAHHIPEDGYAFIFYGPHIGINSEGELGAIRRKGQSGDSTCCGALALALQLLQNPPEESDESEDEVLASYDYQESRLLKVLRKNKAELQDSEHPIQEATELIYDHISTFLNQLIESGKKEFRCKKIALLGGIILNTDHGKEDYVDIRDFTIIDNT